MTSDRELLQNVLGKLTEWPCILEPTCYLRGCCRCLLCGEQPLCDIYNEVLGDHKENCPWIVARNAGVIHKQERRVG
jgi:hypothetical protein